MKTRIKKSSLDKVGVLLKSIRPKAASMSYIRDVTGLPYSSVITICEILLQGNVETIETTNIKYYRWRGK